MKNLRCLDTPLVATAVVLLICGSLVHPLWRLTHDDGQKPEVTAPVVHLDQKIGAVLRVRTLKKLSEIQVHDGRGALVWSARDLDAGENEYDIQIGMDKVVDLKVRVVFSEGSEESAVFLTVLPDGYEDRTRYLIGSGEVEETLSYDWPHENK